MSYKPGDKRVLYVDSKGQITNSQYTVPRDTCGTVPDTREIITVQVISLPEPTTTEDE